MRVRGVLCGVVLMAIAAGLFLGICGGSSVAREETAKRDSILTAAANTFKTSFRLGEPVPLAVAVANCAGEPRYVPASDLAAKWPSFTIWLRDAKGLRVMGDPIPDPLPAPPEYYMEKKGKPVFMIPLWKLESYGGVVVVTPDALKRYHKHLVKGTYTLHVRVGASLYPRESIVRREGLRHEYWAEAASLISQHTLHANVTITIE